VTHYPSQPYNDFLDLVVSGKSSFGAGFEAVPFWDDSYDRQYLLTVDTGQLMLDGVSLQDRFNTNTTGGLQRFEGIKEGGTNNSALLAFRSSNANARTRIDGIASGISIEATSDGFATVGGGIGVTSSGVAITGALTASGTILPTVNNTQHIGSPTAYFNRLHVDRIVTPGLMTLNASGTGYGGIVTGTNGFWDADTFTIRSAAGANRVIVSSTSLDVSHGDCLAQRFVIRTGGTGTYGFLNGTNLFSPSDGVLRVRNSGNAIGTLDIGNLTASGTVTAGGIRLLQSGVTLRGLLNCPAWSDSYVSLQNGTLAESAANSAINQSPLGDTIVNAASGRTLFLRNNNSTIGQVTSTGIDVTGNLTASGNAVFGSGTSFPLSIGQDAGRGSYLTGATVGGTFGLSFASTNIIFPCNATVPVTNTISLGRADYQFLNFFSQNATFSGLLDLRKTATANIIQFSTNTFLRTDTSQLSIFDTGLGRNNISLWRGGNFVVSSGALIAACSSLDSTGGSVDTSLSRNAAGVWQMGTTAANALGSLLLTNLTASGTVQGVGVHSLTNGFAVGNPPLAASVACLRTPNDFRILDDGSLRIDNATTRMLRLRTNTTSVTTTSTLSSGVENMFELIHTVNQTGTAGSTNLLINRTETALGSGEHNFANFQIAGSNRWRVDRLGDMYFHDGANFTRIARAAGASGRLMIYRPNSTGAIAVQFGGGNDEMYIGQSAEGSLRVNGGNLAVGSNGGLILDSLTNTFTFRGSASATMATLTGTGNLALVGNVIFAPPASVTLATNGQFSIEMTSNTAGNLVYRGSDGVTRRAALTFS
jgi:hypothetical protein